MTTKDVAFYIRQLDLADEHERRYRERAKSTIKTYKDDRSSGHAKSTSTGTADRTLTGGLSHFNILWANTQTQLPAMYSAKPKPDVRRRWRESSPVGKEIAQAVERGLTFMMDTYDFDRLGEKVALDYLLPGRAVARVRYHPFFKDEIINVPAEADDDDSEEQEDGSFTANRKHRTLISEDTRAYHVPWDKYRQTPAEDWADVWWVSYGDNFLTQEEIIEQFGSEHKDVPLKFTDDNDNESPDNSHIAKAQVWELWDKQDKKVVAVVRGYDKFLMKEDDPLKLVEFFPQPEPAVLIESPNTMIPIPEYTMYQFQAEELNDVSARIEALVRSMKAKGIYPGEDADKINELFNSDENILIPDPDWASHAEKGGLGGIIDWFPITDVAAVWVKLLQERQEILQVIFQLIGISDIQRGSSDPRETKGAQQLKANFGSRRLIPKQRRLQNFFRDLLKLQGEIIAEHFSTKTLTEMTGTEVTDEMRAIMRSDALRSFTIDIETDSTVAVDEERDKQGMAEFTAAFSSYLREIAPIIEKAPSTALPLGKIALWITRKFKVARDVEDEVEEFLKTFQQGQEQQTSAQDAEIAAQQAEQQMIQQEAQGKQKIKEAESQAEQQRKDKESQADIAREDRESAASVGRDNIEFNAKMRLNKLGDQKAIRDIALLDRKLGTADNSNVIPINKNFQVVRDGDEIVGATMVENGVTKTLTLTKENGKITGGDISA